MRRPKRHGLHRIERSKRRSVRKARDYSAGGEQFWIGSQECACHGAASGKASHENTVTVQLMVQQHFFDHVADRRDLSIIAADVLLDEPIEAILRIVLAFLLGK